jgi:hypothetical protein
MADEWAAFRVSAPAAAAEDEWAAFRTAPVKRADIPEGITRITVGGQAAPGVAEDVVKSAGAGVVKGVAGLAGLPGDIAEYGARGIDYLVQAAGQQFGIDVPKRENRAPTYGSADIGGAMKSGLQNVGINSDYQPATMGGEYARTIGEFLPAAAIGPGGWAARGMQVAVPAVASETAGQLTKGTDAEPYARAGGAIFGGVGAGLMARPGTASRALREQLPPGMTTQHIDDAQALIANARQQGIDLAWPEALSQVAGRPVMTNMMRHLEASPQTEAQMAQFFSQRPQQVEAAARQSFDQISPANPNPSSIGPTVGRTAEGYVDDVRGRINAASEPFYQRSAQVRLSAPEMARVRALPGYPEARDAVLNDPQLARYVRGMPEDSVGFLNEVKKQLDQSATNAASPVTAQQNMQRSAGYGQDATAARDAGIRASSDYETALAIQSGGREQILQPILDGYIGKLANRDLTTKKAIDTLFPKSPIANSEGEIGRTMQTLAARHPRVANDLVRSYLEQAFNKSAKDLQTGPNQAGGAKFRTAVVGDAGQAANLQAAVSALPNGAERWQGFNRFLDVLEATGTRQGIGSRTAYNAEINKAQGAGGLLRDGLKVGTNPLRALQPIIDRYETYKLGNNLQELARILTDPRSAGMLRAVARMDPGSSAAQAVAGRLLTIGAASRPPVQKSSDQPRR